MSGRRSGRVVTIRYTEFAPCVALAARCRWETFYGPPTLGAVQAMLDRMGLVPAAVEARQLAGGDVALLSRMSPDAPPHLCPGKVRPVAFVDGLTGGEIAEALAQLLRQAWRPRDLAWGIAA